MRVLVLHNAYQQRGGEDTVVDAEVAMLQSAGHDVHLEVVSNDSLSGLSQQFGAFLLSPFDPSRRDWAYNLTKNYSADIVHVHNFFPLLTPAIHQGAAQAGAAVVQTLHNYRLLCANGTFLRNNTICEKCLTGSKAWAIAHRCYRGSFAGSLSVVRMQLRAERNSAWRQSIHEFIALTPSSRDVFIKAGISQDRISVKPNFVVGQTTFRESPRQGALFVGRLSVEKGIKFLLEAWRHFPNVDLTIIGDGPLREELRNSAPVNVKFLGQQGANVVHDYMSKSEFLIIPSIWRETFGLVAIEAYAAKLPVIASRIGALEDIVTEGVTGHLFEANNKLDFIRAVKLALSGGSLHDLGRNAFSAYKDLYSVESNLRLLESIYSKALDNADTAR